MIASGHGSRPNHERNNMTNVRDLRAGKHDKRRKLTDEQKKEIVKLYNSGQWSIAELAEEYNVSKATIGFTINPASRKPHKRSYYDREKNTENKRRYRQRLKELRDRGKL